MAKNANPAVIIGLGGTGQWVLTYVKKNLMDTYGEVPGTVQLLAFDTTSAESEAALEISQREEKAQVGDVELGTGEFNYLGGSIYGICKNIANYPHIGSWLQAKYYLGTLNKSAFELAQGAGQRRPFGRMAIFYDFTRGQPEISGRINQALTKVATASQQSRPIEIYIVCSIAGGTGSGMFIDIAHLARVLAQRAGLRAAVRGFLVLQNTFSPVIPVSGVQPSSFAALRELERFMMVFYQEHRNYPMYYTGDPSKRDLQTVYQGKLFDNCYLLDAKRPSKPLDGIEPRLGVFPSVAECITVLLDPETGEHFDAHYKNVEDKLAQTQRAMGKALYSSLGTYTYILPVEDIIERNTYKLALDLVKDRLVGIEHDEELDTIRSTSTRVIEYKTSPRDEAMGFLRMEESRSNVKNVIFCQNVALTLEQPLDQLNVIRGMAEEGEGLLPWLKPVEQDDTTVQAGARIETVLQTNMVEQVLNAKEAGEDYATAANRIIREVRDIRRRHLGQEEIGGRRTIGEFEQGLEDYAKRNRARFQRLLRGKLLLILNGSSENQVAAKTGKLPFAQDFLQVLVRAFEDFEGFLGQVIDHRAQEGSLSQARDYVEQTRQTMRDTVYATSLLDRMRGTAVKAEDAYIENEQYLFELERDEILYRALLSLTLDFKKTCQDAKQVVDDWIDALALGGAPDSGEAGVYKALLSRQSALKRSRDEQERIQVYEYLTDDKFEDRLYGSRISPTQLNEILRRFEWRLVDEKGFNLRLFYGGRTRRDEEEPELLRQPPRRDETATEHNVRLLLEHLRPYFYDIRNETIADRMEDSHTAAWFAKEMLNSSAALISYDAHQQGALYKHNMICANRGVRITYFDNLEDELGKSASTFSANKVIGLSNKHRATILSTVDLVVGQNIGPYTSGAQAYQNYQGDRKLLHNFPAEVNASGFEKKLSQPPLSEASRLLLPELVALLEDQEMARRFALSLVYGLVREEEAPGEHKNQYVLRVDTSSARQRRSENWTLRLTNPAAAPRLLEAMANFVYVHLDPERGIRAIKDVAPGTNVLVQPEQVDQALESREASIISGREVVVAALAGLLRDGRLGEEQAADASRPEGDQESGETPDEVYRGKVADVLRPEGDWLLISAFRSFLAREEGALNRGDMDQIHQGLKKLVENNRDCYQESYAEELATTFNQFIDAYKGGEGITAGGYNRLINRLDRYIEKEVEPLRENRDQLLHDLGSIMYLILWGEIERLERLRDRYTG